MSSETPVKKAGRPPRKSLAQTSARSTFTVRLRGSVRAALIEASENSGRSISEELEHRLEQSFDNDVMRGPAASFLLALRKVTTKVLRMSRDHFEISDDSPEQEERHLRQELRSAIDFVNRVYNGTGEPLPEAFEVDGSGRPNDWGSGDIGRLNAQDYLDYWSDDPMRLAQAQNGQVDFYWTPEPAPRGLADIMNEGSDRERDKDIPRRKSKRTSQA